MERILIVEDDPLVADVLRAVLRKGAWDVRHAADGQEAVAAAVEWKPSLILLDVELPDTNGFSVCAAIRAAEGGSSPLIVMVTAHEDAASKERAAAAGADDYLTKPLIPQQLLARVRSWLTTRGDLSRPEDRH